MAAIRNGLSRALRLRGSLGLASVLPLAAGAVLAAAPAASLLLLLHQTFFISWAMFPLLFLMGPEGFGHLT